MGGTRGRWRAGCVGLAGFLLATPPVDASAAPLEAYGRLPSVSDLALSPDGKRIAMVVSTAATRQIQVRDADSLDVVLAQTIGDLKVVGLDWADKQHLLLVFARASQVIGLTGPRQEWRIGQVLDLTKQRFANLMDGTEAGMNVIEGWPQTRVVDGASQLYMNGFSFPGTTGILTLYRERLDGSGLEQVEVGDEATEDFLVDDAGRAVARVDYSETSGIWSLLARHDHRIWRSIAKEVAPIDAPSLEGFGRTADTLIVEKTENDISRYREIPIAGGAWSSPIAALDGAALIKDPIKRTVIGGVVTEDLGLRFSFLDSADQRVWDAVARAFPDETVRLESWSDDRSRVLLRVEGAKHGASFFLLDRASRHADWIADEYAGVRPDDLGEVRSIHYKAADGVDIPAYLTLPLGAAPKGLPLVMLVHGGPAARDEPGFDWWSQALASLGYAVLQPQFRGSSGFGADFTAAGYGEWGRRMQSDLSDGVKALAAQGIVDAGRVCIAGASYGGYAAMAGVTLQSGLYRCAVAVAGVSDLRRFLAEESNANGNGNNSTLRYWRRFIGSKTDDDPILDTLSPARHADRLDAPLLLIHGTIDTVVPPDQSQIMLAAARRANKPVQLVTLAGEDHNLSRGATRLQMLSTMAEFLRAHLAPSTVPAGAASAGGTR